MEIQKNDIIGFVKNVERQLNDKKANAKKASVSSAGKTAESASGQRLNKVMSGTLKIQEEIRSLQTEYSRHQSALAFVKNSEDGAWQNELKKFLSTSFRYNPDILPETTKEQFLQDSGGTLAQLKNEILKKEVVMQNIISASPLSETGSHETMNKVLEDANSLRELVVALRTGSVKKLTQE